MKRMLACICSFVLLFQVTACSKQIKEEGNELFVSGSELKMDEDALLGNEENQEANHYEKRYELRQLVDKEYVKSVNEFSYQIASLLLSNQSSNAMLSPISIQLALALACIGAEGETYDEIMTTLKLENQEKGYLSKQSSYLNELLTTTGDVGRLSIANSLWMKQNMAFEEDYTKRAKENFNASLYQVDFMEETTSQKMKQWILENTGGLISPSIGLHPETILSIMNTIYLKDEWAYRILEEETAPADFNLSDTTKVSCNFMNFHRINYNYMETDELLSTYIPLKDTGNMHFILPKEGVTVDALLKEPDVIAQVLHTYDRGMAEVTLKLPKFSFASKFELRDALIDLGMKSAFEYDADFSGITKEGMAFLSQITHQSHIAINEKGVEAAAYTEVLLCGSSMAEDKKSVEINLNRPFIFAITNEDVVLFVGVVNNPLQ